MSDSKEQVISTFSKINKIKVLWSLGVSLFWVVYMWGFWEHGVYAFGVNAFVYLALLSGLFVWVMWKKEVSVRENLFWLIPLGLIIISYLIYDNPFLKVVNIFVLPFVFAIFYNYSFLTEKSKTVWSLRYLIYTFGRILYVVPAIGVSISQHAMLWSSTKKKGSVFKRVLLGLVLFLIIALTVIVPLLSSADAVFADKMSLVMKWVQTLVSTTIVYKFITFIIFSVIITATVTAWSNTFVYKEKDGEKKHADPIITGIVLVGILLLYLLFLGIQIQHLWIGALPFEFKEAVYLVKSGFWQLFFLTVINIIIYFFTYKKTAPFVQKILTVFTITSLLLLVSAGHRMALYVINYGFSYEKFFATYTVLFCAILFVWLISRMFVHKRSDIVKFIIVLFVWMYAVLTIFPVEQFVLRTNVALAQRPESKIRLYELTMLSLDVLGTVERYQQEGKLKETVPQYGREYIDKKNKLFDWTPWIENNRNIIERKAWYEKNVTNWFYEL